MKPEIFQFPDHSKEIHVMGNYVGVCFRIEKKTTRVRDGNKIVTTDTWNKEEYPMPYIDFVWIRMDSKNEPYVDDDSPVDGGLSTKEANQLANELILAIQYIEERHWE